MIKAGDEGVRIGIINSDSAIEDENEYPVIGWMQRNALNEIALGDGVNDSVISQ